MSLRVTLTTDPLDLSALTGALQNRAPLYARIAGDAEVFVKARGAQTSQTEHRSAQTLGAQPTGHLADAYEAIESTSSDQSAALLIPTATRLRAAFGGYVLTPKNSKFLTLPAHRDAYGKRAREFDDLFPMRVGPRKTLVLARRVQGQENFLLRARPNQRRDNRRIAQAEIMYVLLAKVTIPEDRTLIPFDDLKAEARDSAQAYIDEAIESALTATP